MMYMLGLISSCTGPFYKHTLKWPFHSPIGVQIFLNGDKKYASCAKETPIGVKKMFATPIGDSIRFSGKNENQSISVINNFLFRSFKKKSER